MVCPSLDLHLGLDLDLCLSGLLPIFMKFITQNRTYKLRDLGDGAWHIKGHPTFCPEWTLVRLLRSVVVGESVFLVTIQPGPRFGKVTRTSTVKEIIP